MLFVADIKKDKRVQQKKEEQVYGLDKLKLIDLKCLLLLMLTILQEYKQFIKKQILVLNL